MSSSHRNQLANETSPYLLQHADNPVDWRPWGAAALEEARRDDKPILLSIGYSACHWCHVMAHESFEDETTAVVMNRLFVNIKVDREERPDLDKIYQLAHQMLTGRGGGWPLTMFLAPDDQVPFFGGTYFPREPRYGLPSFREILERVAAAYRENRDAIGEQNREVLDVFAKLDRATDVSVEELGSAPLDMARHQLEHAFDGRYGGFSDAPKFPHPPNIQRLLRRWAESDQGGEPDETARHMAVFTLRKMAEGGIYDQLGGGFYRYSVDGQWTTPHFEKMLYDNAQLLQLYVEAWQATGEDLFRRIAVGTAQWVMREMQSPEGGYYSALDADSEGEEGRFYVWSREQLRELLDDDEYDVFTRRFAVDGKPNFEGRWHLRIGRELDEIDEELGMGRDMVGTLAEKARSTALRAREQRMRPLRDEKILTAWNALMIRGMAFAARHLERPELLASAESALGFIRAQLWRDQRLLATCKDGKAHLNGYLDDYAFLLDATLELVQTRWRSEDIRFAVALADAMLDHFEDQEAGGFFFTANDHEALIHRSRPFGDDALPGGNAVAVKALARLGHILAEKRYLDAAERSLRAGWSQLSELPYAHNTLLEALQEYLHPPQLIVLRGHHPDLDEWHRLCASSYAPHRLTLAIPADAINLPGVLADCRTENETVAYMCTAMSCSLPIRSLAELEETL